jgi:hypothetical protein
LVFIISIFAFSGEQELNYAEFELYDQMDTAKVAAIEAAELEMVAAKEEAPIEVKKEEVEAKPEEAKETPAVE